MPAERLQQQAAQVTHRLQSTQPTFTDMALRALAIRAREE
jgi:hypothetical protein